MKIQYGMTLSTGSARSEWGVYSDIKEKLLLKPDCWSQVISHFNLLSNRSVSLCPLGDYLGHDAEYKIYMG